MKVVWKLFQFKKIIVCEPGLRFFETFSESGGLPWQMTYFCCFAHMATSTFYAILPQKEIYNFFRFVFLFLFQQNRQNVSVEKVFGSLTTLNTFKCGPKNADSRRFPVLRKSQFPGIRRIKGKNDKSLP